MEKLEGFETAKTLTGESTQLPKGGYIAKIMDCKEIKGPGYAYLAFSFDIAEGEYKGYFTNIYKASTDENKKWKGTYNAFIPQKNNQYYEEGLIKFKTMTAAFEDSNNGYHWDWKEDKLKGKMIGVIFGEKEYKPDGKDDIFIITEAKGFRSVQQINSGKFKIPDLKKLKQSASTADAFTGFAPVDSDDDLPFK